jgi:hypothetical protein
LREKIINASKWWMEPRPSQPAVLERADGAAAAGYGGVITMGRQYQPPRAQVWWRLVALRMRRSAIRDKGAVVVVVMMVTTV